MASRKAERLMNVVICLLVSRHVVPKQKIRQLVEDYRELTPDAFEKMFERDKEELRELGIPIELGSMASGFDDEVGYRIRRQEFELPPLAFSGEEAAVLGLAARVWQHASLADATARAVVKLGADGLATDTSALSALEPRLPAQEPAFEPLWRAVQTRVVVTFDYRRPGTPAPTSRTLEPWGILNWRGRWYVVGHDRGREATRMFRLSRIVGRVKEVGRPNAFVVPDGVDIRAEATQLAPNEHRGVARMRVRSGAGHGLRRRAGATKPDGDDWDLIEVSYGDPHRLADEVSSYAEDVVVLEPAEVRDSVIARLRGIVEGAPL